MRMHKQVHTLSHAHSTQHAHSRTHTQVAEELGLAYDDLHLPLLMSAAYGAQPEHLPKLIVLLRCPIERLHSAFYGCVRACMLGACATGCIRHMSCRGITMGRDRPLFGLLAGHCAAVVSHWGTAAKPWWSGGLLTHTHTHAYTLSHTHTLPTRADLCPANTPPPQVRPLPKVRQRRAGVPGLRPASSGGAAEVRGAVHR